MEPPSRLIAVKPGSSFEGEVQSTDPSTFKDVIEDPTEWLREKVKGREDVRLWVEFNVDRGRKIYLGVSLTNKTLEYRRITHKWFEIEDEGYESCLGGDKIGWRSEESYGFCEPSEIIVVELSPKSEYCTLSGSLKE